MVATGLVMWNISRKKRKNAQGNPPFSHRLVESLNIAVIPGLFIAIASYLTCSRLIPAEMAGRVELERQIFFAVWVLCLVHAMVRTTKSRAWIEQFVAAGTLFVLLPMINAITGGAHLLSSMRHGLWSIAGFDVMALIFGLAFFGIAGKIFRYASLASAREYEEGETGKAFQFEPVPIDSGGHP